MSEKNKFAGYNLSFLLILNVYANGIEPMYLVSLKRFPETDAIMKISPKYIKEKNEYILFMILDRLNCFIHWIQRINKMNHDLLLQ